MFSAWRKFARGKRSREDILTYQRNLEDNLFELHTELVDGTYRHNAYEPFMIRDPKERCIHKATVRDRVAHQAVFNIIEPIFERRFIFDSFSCRTGKGTHAASYRLRALLRKASCNNTKTVYALKCDISKFFDTVDHTILLRLLARKVSGQRSFQLLTHVVTSFEKQPNKGLPIGNLTSQLFANVYMHEFDHFVKHILRAKWYMRYCDDFLLLSTDRELLLGLLSKIEYFLKDFLKLAIHPHKISLRTWRQGIDFIGYVHLPHCVILRQRTKHRMLRRISINNVSSYFGLCKHADTFELWQRSLNIVGYQRRI